MKKQVEKLVKELKLDVSEEEMKILESFADELNRSLKPLNDLTKKIAENKDTQDELIISIYDYFNTSEK